MRVIILVVSNLVQRVGIGVIVFFLDLLFLILRQVHIRRQQTMSAKPRAKGLWLKCAKGLRVVFKILLARLYRIWEYSPPVIIVDNDHMLMSLLD